MEPRDLLIEPSDLILVTGATGFIGSRVVRSLWNLGFRNIRCLTRHSADTKARAFTTCDQDGARPEVMQGNLLSRQDCARAARNTAVIVHLAAGRGQKSFADAFANSVVTTRNLLDTCVGRSDFKRFVNVSSFSVYSNQQKPRRRLLDESCPLEQNPGLRGDAYSFAKSKQDEIVDEYAERAAVPFVVVRPGYVYGPGNLGITGRVGIGTFGLFLHLGGSNRIPFTYVDNCADAIALAGLAKHVDGEVFNVVDDNLPTSRQFLRLYKRNVRRFSSIYVPHCLSYALCCGWEWYSRHSERQLLPNFNRREWHAYWKKTRYTNEKLKKQLGWSPRVSTADGLQRYFEACRNAETHA